MRLKDKILMKGTKVRIKPLDECRRWRHWTDHMRSKVDTVQTIDCTSLISNKEQLYHIKGCEYHFSESIFDVLYTGCLN